MIEITGLKPEMHKRIGARQKVINNVWAWRRL